MYTSAPSSLTPRQPGGFDLLIMCGLLSVLMAAVSAIALVSIASVRDSAREAVAVDGQLSQLASEVTTQSLESRRYEKDFFLNAADPSVRSDYLAKWHTASAQLDQAITVFAVAATAPEDQQQATRWRMQAVQYEQAFEQFAQALIAENSANSEAANTAFMPFKETIRVLTESSMEIAKQKAAMERTTGVQLESIGMRSMRSIGLIGVLATLILLSAIGYSTRDMLRVRRDCIECAARLPLRSQLAGQRRCRSCEVARLARLIADAEERQ